jgi:hypothetical protein
MSMAASLFRMSPGSEMKTGPVGSVVATLAARRRMRGRSSMRLTSVAPLHDRLGDRHQRRVEQGLGEAVALFLLARRHDHRRARHEGGVDRADGVAEARRDMDVARDQLARSAGIAVGHGDHDGFLQA